MAALSSVVAYWPMEEGAGRRVRAGRCAAAHVHVHRRHPLWESDTSFDCSAALPNIGTPTGRPTSQLHEHREVQVRFLLSSRDGLADGTVLAHFTTTGTITRWDLTYEIVNGVSCLGLFRYGTGGYTTRRCSPTINGSPSRLSLD
jgi:hypothetical protein